MKTLLPLLLLTIAPAVFAAPAACPDTQAQLTEYLASAKQRIRSDGEVRVEFEVNAEGRARLLALDGSRAYRNPVRIAMQMLDCEGGAPQRYVLNIRFADPLPITAMAAASATIAQTVRNDPR